MKRSVVPPLIGAGILGALGVRPILPIVLLLSMAPPTMAQVPADSAALADSANVLHERAKESYGTGTREGVECAIELWIQARQLFQRVGNRPREGAMLNNAGVAFHALGATDSALVYHRRALEIHRDLGDRARVGSSLMGLGGVHYHLGKPDSALAYWRQALSIKREVGDRAGVGSTLTNIGNVHADLGYPDSALICYRQALTVHREVGDRRGEGMALSNIGGTYRDLGRPDSALAYWRQALLIDREVNNRRSEGITLDNIGAVHGDLGRSDSALVYFRQALAVYREVGHRIAEGGVLGNIGVVYGRLGHTDSAFVQYRQALAIHREVNDRRNEGSTLDNIADLHIQLGELDSALVYYRRSLAIRREVRDRRGEGATLGSLGIIHAELGRPDSALVLFRRALALGREARDPRGEGAALRNLGELYRQDVMLRDPDKAVAYYDSSAAVRAQVAAHAGSDPNRLSYAEQYVGLFEDWALAWMAKSYEVGIARSARSALAVAERGRAQALLDLMRTTAGGPASVVSPVQALMTPGADLAMEGARLAEAVTQSGAAGLSYLMTDDTLLIWLIEPSGEVSLARQPVSRDSVLTLVRALRAGLGVDDAAAGSKLALRGALRLEVATKVEGAATLHRGLRYAEAAAEVLAQLLLPGELAARLPESGELVIVPQGPLALVPFSALPLGGGDGGGMEPFGNRYAMRYSPSLATLRLVEQRSSVSPREGLSDAVVVGNPRMPEVVTVTGERVRLAPLPLAEAEAQWLAERLGTAPLSGPEATEGLVRQRLAESRLVHLATHGYAYSTEAWARQSFVALAPDESHDGRLTVGEILDDPALEFQADLVVLSACQTGLGDLKEAEGTVGLQRAFLAKGARSVLVSLWSVADEVTSELMNRFYTHWLDDKDRPSKAEALRRAEVDIRNTPGWDHPRFWAAFQLVGAE